MLGARTWITWQTPSTNSHRYARNELNGKRSSHSIAASPSPSVHPCTDGVVMVGWSNCMAGLEGVLYRYDKFKRISVSAGGREFLCGAAENAGHGLNYPGCINVMMNGRELLEMAEK